MRHSAGQRPHRTLPGPDVRLGSFRMPAYRLLAILGLLAGVWTAVGTGARLGIAPGRVLAVVVVGVAGSCAVLVVRASRGSSDWVWHEHEASALAAASGVGLWAGEPLALLDATVTGLLVVLAVGRFGCLYAGCCHGRPVRGRRWGVRYGPAHVRAGLPAPLLGRRLVPVQAIEAVGVLALATPWLLVSGLPPGALLVSVLGGRLLLRTVLETWRGDHGPVRGTPLRLPQWWACTVALVLLALTVAGLLPIGAWSILPAAEVLLVLAMLAAATRPRILVRATG